MTTHTDAPADPNFSCVFCGRGEDCQCHLDPKDRKPADDLVERLERDAIEISGWGAGLEAQTVREAAALIRQLKADNERMREGFERQTENMAFVLNHATLPEQWHEKFVRELEEDRAAQSLNQTERD